MNNTPNPTGMMDALQEHLGICQALLTVVERERQALRERSSDLNPEYAEKKNLLPALTESLNRIRQHRIEWGRRSPRDREKEPGVPSLLRQLQDLIMRIIVVDRENEQALLRKGLVPAHYLPHPNRQRPHFVASLYQQQKRIDAAAPIAGGIPA